MTRKPHPSSVLKTLSDEDQSALFEFLRAHTLAEGVQWLFSNNGVRTNDTSLSEWRSWYQMRQQIAGWNSEVEELKSLLSTDKAIDANLIPKIAEAVFISRAAREGDAKTFAAVASVIQRQKELENQQAAHADRMKLEGRKLRRKDRQLDQMQTKLEQAERKLQAQEARIRAAEAAMVKATGDGGMTEETLKLVRKALGMTDPEDA
jgi:hypothetical protein